MKLKVFTHIMKKPCFTFEEARLVAFETPVAVLRLQLHQWTESHELTRLKRGVYCFPERVHDQVEMARVLYAPSYISLESALNYYGLIPDVTFALTLVTTKATRRIVTPLGRFEYHRIHPDLFWGFNSKTLMGEKEKVLIDYCYLNGAILKPDPRFWEALRLQNLHLLDFNKLKAYAARLRSSKTQNLISSIVEYYGTR